MTEAVTKPSVILRSFHGGIVNEPNVALELADIILKGQQGGTKPDAIRTLRAEDEGDRWAISSADPSRPDPVGMRIRKLDAAVLSTNDELPLALPTVEAARKFAAALVKAERGEDGQNQQRPFSILDQGANWRVTGNRNSDRSVPGPGRFYLDVQKSNAQVLDISTEWVLPIPHEVKAMLRKPNRQYKKD